MNARRKIMGERIISCALEVEQRNIVKLQEDEICLISKTLETCEMLKMIESYCVVIARQPWKSSRLRRRDIAHDDRVNQDFLTFCVFCQRL